MAVPGQRNKLLLEKFPIFGLVGLFIVFTFAVICLVGLSSFYPPMYPDPVIKDIIYTRKDFEALMRGETSLTFNVGDLSALNEELSVSFILFPNTNITGFTSSLLLLNNITAKAGTTSMNLVGDVEPHKMAITCRQNVKFYQELACDSVMLFKTLVMLREEFEMYLKFVDNPKAKTELFKPQITLMFSYIDKSYSVLEILFRYMFLGTTLVFLSGFLLINRFRQEFSCWHDEQRWVAILLAGLVAFNNPLFVLQYYSASDFFTLLNIGARVSFVLLIMLWLLVFTHGLYVQPKDRTFSSFYLPKITLILLLWIMSLFSFVYAAERNIKNPAYNYQNDFAYFGYIQATTVTVVVLYLLMLGYYVMRTFGLYDMLPVRFTGKFKIVWGMTILVVVVSTITLISLKTLHMLTDAVVFLSFQCIFNMYVYLLSLLFSASSEPETVRDMSDVPLVGLEDD